MIAYENNNIGRIILLVASAFTFAYCFGVAVHEVGHVVAYQYYGIATEKLVLDPFGHSYMVPVIENAAGELLQRSGGSLFNIFCACCLSAVFWKKHNLYAFPILMWAGAAFIQESVAIILDILNGSTFDWALVVKEGISVYLVLLLSAVFMFIGCSIFLRLLAIAGVRPNYPITRIMMICLLGISPFFVLSLIYVSLFLVSEQDNWVFSKSIALGASILLSLIFSLLFKPLYPMLQKILPINTQSISQGHVTFSILVALSFFIFCAFLYN